MSGQHTINYPEKFNHSLSSWLILGIFMWARIHCKIQQSHKLTLSFHFTPTCPLHFWEISVKLYIKWNILSLQDCEKPALEKKKKIKKSKRFVTASETLLAVSSMQQFQCICREPYSPLNLLLSHSKQLPTCTGQETHCKGALFYNTLLIITRWDLRKL